MNLANHHFILYTKGGTGKTRDAESSGTGCCGCLNTNNIVYNCEFYVRHDYLKKVDRTVEDLVKWVDLINDNTPFKMQYIGEDIRGSRKVSIVGIDYEDIGGGGPVGLATAIALRYIYNQNKFPKYDEHTYMLMEKNPDESVLQALLYAGYCNPNHNGYYAHIPGNDGFSVPVLDKHLEERIKGGLKGISSVFQTLSEHYVAVSRGDFKILHVFLCDKFKELNYNITEFRKYLLDQLFGENILSFDGKFKPVNAELIDLSKNYVSTGRSTAPLKNPVIASFGIDGKIINNITYRFECADASPNYYIKGKKVGTYKYSKTSLKEK